MDLIFMIFIAIIYIIFGVTLPIKLLATNIKKSEKESERPIKYVLLKSFKLICYFIVFVIVMSMSLAYYNTAFPSSTSDVCTSSGGWVYSCFVNWEEVIIPLFAMFLTIIIYYLLCEIEIHNMFRMTRGKLKYVALIFYLLLMVGFNLGMIIILYGLFISIYFDSMLMEIFRFVVAFLPMSIFAISTYLRCLIKKLASK